jgi:hypothetical protein
MTDLAQLETEIVGEIAAAADAVGVYARSVEAARR